MKLYVLAMLLCFFSFSCQRANEGSSSRISIQMPTSSNSLDFKSVSSSKMGDVSSQSDFSTVVPSSVGVFNCFMVTIGGPELYLNRNRCGKKATGAATNYNLAFGPMIAGISEGKTLAIDVASGSDRVITLIGFQATACQDYRSAGFDQNNLSKPYILGQSGKMTLKPSLDATVIPISMHFDGDAWFDDCVGPEIEQGSAYRSATMAVVRKNAFPKDRFVAGQCNLVEIELKDSQYRTAYASKDLNFNLQKVVPALGSSLDILPTSATYTQCDQLVTQPGFIIPQGAASVKRWIKAPLPSPPAPSIRLSLNFLDTGLKADPAEPEVTFKNEIIGTPQLAMIGPASIIPNTCYKYDLTTKNNTINLDPLMGAPSVMSLTAPSDATIYSGAGCTLPVTPTPAGVNNVHSIQMSSGTGFSTPIYVKYTASDKKELFSLSSASGDSTFASYVSTTSPAVTHLAVRENAYLPNTSYAYCYGPLHLALVNDFGAEVLSTVTHTFTIAGAPSPVVTLSVNGCGGGNVSTIFIPGNASNVQFYLNYSTNTAPGPHVITFTENSPMGLPLNYNFTFNLN